MKAIARPHMGNWASRPSSFQDPVQDGSYMVEAVSEVSGDEFDRDDSDADDLDGYETAEESFVTSYCYNETNNNENSGEDYNNSEDSGEDYEGYDLVNEYSEQQIEDDDDFSTSSDEDNVDFTMLLTTEIMVSIKNQNTGETELFCALLDSGTTRSLGTRSAIERGSIGMKESKRTHSYRTTIGTFQTKHKAKILSHKLEELNSQRKLYKVHVQVVDSTLGN